MYIPRVHSARDITVHGRDAPFLLCLEWKGGQTEIHVLIQKHLNESDRAYTCQID